VWGCVCVCVWTDWIDWRSPVQIRGSVVVEVYRKAFRQSASARQQSTVGEIVNLYLSFPTVASCLLAPTNGSNNNNAVRVCVGCRSTRSA
jgi:hypothetical protein